MNVHIIFASNEVYAKDMVDFIKTVCPDIKVYSGIDDKGIGTLRRLLMQDQRAGHKSIVVMTENCSFMETDFDGIKSASQRTTRAMMAIKDSFIMRGDIVTCSLAIGIETHIQVS